MNSNLQTIAEADDSSEAISVQQEVMEGLLATPKRLASKFFYDARGSELFEEICQQPEYYLTRAEIEIMQTHAPAIAWAIGERVRLVEFGSGSGLKTRILLENLKSPAAYVPIEISPTALVDSVMTLRALMPTLEIIPLVADFTQQLPLPRSQAWPRRTVVFFPGSTLGNLDPHAALGLLKNIRLAVGIGGGALIGIDLMKDPAVMTAAYNDQAGVTAAFTLNMLAHLNQAAGSDFDLSQFAHHAAYDVLAGRIETNLVSLSEQTVRVADASFHFAKGERLLVEYSHKYSLEEFRALAMRANLRDTHVWTDYEGRFALVHLVSTLNQRA